MTEHKKYATGGMCTIGTILLKVIILIVHFRHSTNYKYFAMRCQLSL